MNLAQNIKNNQIAWGAGIGATVIIGLFGGVIWIATEPFQTAKEDPDLPQNTSTEQTTSSSSIPEPSSPDPKEYQRDTLNGALVSKNVSQRTITITPKGLPEDRPDELNVSVSKQTPIKLRTAKNDQVSFQKLSFEDLRNKDTVILKFSEPITSYKEPLKPQEVIISASP